MADLSQVRVGDTLYNIKDATARMAMGAPSVAATASAMIDQGRVYVYTGSESGYTNGNWYYYNGSSWVSGGVYNSAAVETDTSLSVSGSPADAKVTGDYIKDMIAVGQTAPSEYTQVLLSDTATEVDLVTASELQNAIQHGGGFNAEVKAALYALVSHIGAWTDGGAQQYIDNLYSAMYPPVNLLYITAAYTQSGTVYSTDSLDSLKSDLVVTAYHTDGTTSTVGDYVLSGTLAEGTSTIIVTYGGKTATFNVTVTKFVRYAWKLSDGDFNIQAGSITWDTTHDINTSTQASSINGRRNIYTDAGVKPYYTTANNASYSVTDPPQYPIPVPSDATSCTYTITPSTQFVGAAFYTYDESTNMYTRTDDVGWKQGSHTFTFTAGSKHYMTIATKYNSSGTSYPTEPTEITISFE